MRSAIQISPRRKETCSVRYELLLAKPNRTKEKKLPHLTVACRLLGATRTLKRPALFLQELSTINTYV